MRCRALDRKCFFCTRSSDRIKHTRSKQAEERYAYCYENGWNSWVKIYCCWVASESHWSFFRIALESWSRRLGMCETMTIADVRWSIHFWVEHQFPLICAHRCSFLLAGKMVRQHSRVCGVIEHSNKATLSIPPSTRNPTVWAKPNVVYNYNYTIIQSPHN